MPLYLGSNRVALNIVHGLSVNWTVKINGYDGTSVSLAGLTKQISSSGSVTFNIAEAGVYTITAVRNGVTRSETVTLTTSSRSVSVDIYIEVLPYTELQYIRSTGTQWISTGISVKPNTSIRFKANIPYFNGTGKVLGYAQDVTGAPFCVAVAGNALYLYNRSASASVIGSTDVVQEHTIISDVLSEVGTIYINEVNTSITAFGPVPAYWYEFEILEGTQTVFNGIPVKRNSDNEICMWDTVSQTFKLNGGSGSFIAGPEK